eukprot:gnl/TRDRNA2_/TRDRNA2_190181_c0_seq1.p1 gnl/TRDRNA2_/TRDRNA2_190181_c0~~gnl/TRDRNA2_/TRDRNA2_190181_c0_seq1.p1  ORF type:complete len:292 (+),score=85.49 gnl/TRDRNA2_/TRDRNA2_190181_c0_seq1:37-912(+)
MTAPENEGEDPQDEVQARDEEIRLLMSKGEVQKAMNLAMLHVMHLRELQKPIMMGEAQLLLAAAAVEVFAMDAYEGDMLELHKIVAANLREATDIFRKFGEAGCLASTFALQLKLLLLREQPANAIDKGKEAQRLFKALSKESEDGREFFMASEAGVIIDLVEAYLSRAEVMLDKKNMHEFQDSQFLQNNQADRECGRAHLVRERQQQAIKYLASAQDLAKQLETLGNELRDGSLLEQARVLQEQVHYRHTKATHRWDGGGPSVASMDIAPPVVANTGKRAPAAQGFSRYV